MDANGLEVLDHGECVRLLSTMSLGRLAISAEALPTIVPVNYALDDDQVVVHTRRGSQLAKATRNSVVAFEVDDFDDLTGAGWSVVVRGFAREVTEGLLPHPPMATRWPWGDPTRTRPIAISLDLVSGRRLQPSCGGHDPAQGRAPGAGVHDALAAEPSRTSREVL